MGADPTHVASRDEWGTRGMGHPLNLTMRWISSGLLAVIAVNGDILLHAEGDAGGARGVVRLRILLLHQSGERLGVGGGLLGAMAIVLAVHGDQHSLAVDGLIEGLRSFGAVGIALGVLLIEAGLHL